MRALLVTLLVSALSAVGASAADYYASASGTANWASGCLVGDPCSLATINTNITTGNRCLMKAGTYSSSPIQPANDGSSNASRIIYQVFGDGDVILNKFTGSAPNSGAIRLDDSSYVSVIGRTDADPVTTRRLKFLLPLGITGMVVSVCGGTGNVIENIKFESTEARAFRRGFAFCAHAWSGNGITEFNILRRSHITGNSINSGEADTSAEDVISFGDEPRYNLVEDNILDGAARHITLNNQNNDGIKVVVRGNTIHNGAHTAMSVWQTGPNHMSENNFIRSHKETVSCSGPECEWSHNHQTGTGDYLSRYNVLYEGCVDPCPQDTKSAYGITFKGDAPLEKPLNYRIYNNTMVDQGGTVMGLGDNAVGDAHNVGDGVMVNNFIYDGNAENFDDILLRYRPELLSSNNGGIFVNDRYISNVLGNPGETGSEDIIQEGPDRYTLNEAITLGTDTADYADWNGFANVYDASPGFANYANNDFSLPEGNDYIDAGSPLTQVATADIGSGTSLILDDARFFYDPSGFPTWMGVQWDTIAVGSNKNDITGATKIQLTAINYTTNTATLASGISRSDGDFVWLWKDSSGRQVVQGVKPDIGALEFEQETTGPDVEGANFSGATKAELRRRRLNEQGTR